MEKPIPSLAIDTPVAEYAEVFGIDGKRIPDVSNEIAAILLANNFRLRSCGAVLAASWDGWRSKPETILPPAEFLKAVTEQSLNYCAAFSARAERAE